MVIAAILGGGTGSRMGGELPKQFLDLGGEAVILRSLRAFIGSGLVDAAVLLAPEAFVPFAEGLLEKAGLRDGAFPRYGSARRGDPQRYAGVGAGVCRTAVRA